MRIGAPAITHWTAALSAQLTQTVGQAAGHRSVSTERPVDPVNMDVLMGSNRRQ